MTIIGFDVSKTELVGVKVNKRGEMIESFSVINTETEIVKFLDSQKAIHNHMLLASEATAEYHRSLVLACLDKKIPFRLLNPITTKQYTRATVRKKKTDLSDAHVIAKLALQNQGVLQYKELYNPEKTIIRTAQKLARIQNAIYLMQKRMQEHYPEQTGLFEELEKSGNQLKLSIKVLRKQAISMIPKKEFELLCSVPGIGAIIAPILLSEIGTVSRFNSAKSLVAYAGLDPRVRQSGISLNRNTKITKRGSPYLRRALFLAASVAEKHDQELKTYYNKKRAEGKRYTQVTVAVARKLIYRVYAVLKRGTEFTKSPVIT